MDEMTLLPCPACGSTDVQVIRKYDGYVGCMSPGCEMDGPVGDLDGAKWNALPRKTAPSIVAWAQRPDAPADPMCPACKGSGTMGYGGTWRECHCRRTTTTTASGMKETTIHLTAAEKAGLRTGVESLPPVQTSPASAPERVHVCLIDRGGMCWAYTHKPVIPDTIEYILSSAHEAKVRELEGQRDASDIAARQTISDRDRLAAEVERLKGDVMVAKCDSFDDGYRGALSEQARCFAVMAAWSGYGQLPSSPTGD